VSIRSGIGTFLGTWKHVAPWDSDDWLSEYTIAESGGELVVTARDTNDGEAFVVSDVQWDGSVLRFRTLMPSTGREGLNEFRASADGSLQSRFTFTVLDRLERAET
jgi:hypothetical protein